MSGAASIFVRIVQDFRFTEAQSLHAHKSTEVITMFKEYVASVSAFIACALVTTTVANAQRHWVVDSLKGPGHDFETIAPAIAAASEGDTIFVRAGKYAFPASVTKAVRLVGEPNAILDLNSLGTPLSVSGIRAGKTFALVGFRVELTFAPSGITSIKDSQGTVSLEDLVIHGLFFDVHAVQIERCSAVFVTRCDITGGLATRDSAITVDSCTISPFSRSSTVLFQRSEATISASQAQGINGLIVPAQAAVGAADSKLRVLAGAGSKFTAGGFAKVAAIVGDATSTINLDPLVTLVPSGGASPYEGFGAVTTRRMPVLGVAGASVGGIHRLTVHAPANGIYSLFIGLPGRAPAPPFGDLWIDPARLYHITTRSVPAGLAILTIPATKDSSLRGLTATWQALGVDGTNYELTNPAITTLR